MANQIIPQKSLRISLRFAGEETTVSFMNTDGTVTIKKLSEIAADDPVQKTISKYEWGRLCWWMGFEAGQKLQKRMNEPFSS